MFDDKHAKKPALLVQENVINGELDPGEVRLIKYVRVVNNNLQITLNKPFSFGYNNPVFTVIDTGDEDNPVYFKHTMDTQVGDISHCSIATEHISTEDDDERVSRRLLGSLVSSMELSSSSGNTLQCSLGFDSTGSVNSRATSGNYHPIPHYNNKEIENSDPINSPFYYKRARIRMALGRGDLTDVGVMPEFNISVNNVISSYTVADGVFNENDLSPSVNYLSNRTLTMQCDIVMSHKKGDQVETQAIMDELHNVLSSPGVRFEIVFRRGTGDDMIRFIVPRDGALDG